MLQLPCCSKHFGEPGQKASRGVSASGSSSWATREWPWPVLFFFVSGAAIHPSVWCIHPSLCLFPRGDCVWQHRMVVSMLSLGSGLKVGCFLMLKMGLVTFALSIWMPLNFVIFYNFKLVLHSWMLDWFVSNCPGFLSESVLPAVPVMLTAFCTMGRKQVWIWKSLRLDALLKIVRY